MQKAYVNVHVNYAMSIFVEFVKGRLTFANLFIVAVRICKCALINVEFLASCVLLENILSSCNCNDVISIKSFNCLFAKIK